jgi:hypothetical protein
MYQSMTNVFAARRPDESLLDPQSPVARRADVRIMSFRALGIDDQRIRAVSAIAKIDLFNAVESLRSTPPEDFGAQA